MAEDYVRPPIVALEPRSRGASIWRFRIALIVLFIAIAVAVFVFARAIIETNNNNAQAGRSPAVNVRLL